MVFTHRDVSDMAAIVTKDTGVALRIENQSRGRWKVYQSLAGHCGKEITSAGNPCEVWHELRAWWRGWKDSYPIEAIKPEIVVPPPPPNVARGEDKLPANGEPANAPEDLGWSKADGEIAQRQGWNIFNAGPYRQIEKSSEAGSFLSDPGAVEFVIRQARVGDGLALRAVASLLRWPSFKSPLGSPITGKTP